MGPHIDPNILYKTLLVVDYHPTCRGSQVGLIILLEAPNIMFDGFLTSRHPGSASERFGPPNGPNMLSTSLYHPSGHMRLPALNIAVSGWHRSVKLRQKQGGILAPAHQNLDQTCMIWRRIIGSGFDFGCLRNISGLEIHQIRRGLLSAKTCKDGINPENLGIFAD